MLTTSDVFIGGLCDFPGALGNNNYFSKFCFSFILVCLPVSEMSLQFIGFPLHASRPFCPRRVAMVRKQTRGWDRYGSSENLTFGFVFVARS